MNEYLTTKAKFIELSRQTHLCKDPYDGPFQIATDCVRSVFNVEPVYYGAKRSAFESRATQALIGIMKSQTDISDTHLAKLLKKSDTTSVYYNHKKHVAAYQTEEQYRARYNQALVNFIQL